MDYLFRLIAKVNVDFVHEIVHVGEQEVFHEFADLGGFTGQQEGEKELGQIGMVGQEE